MSILSTLTVIAGTGVIAAAVIGQMTGPSIVTEIEIAAKPEAVWSELTDTAAYPDWNPFVRKIAGDLRAGEKIDVTVGADGATQMDFTPEILVANANEELRWVGRLGFTGIFDGEHYFILQETEVGTTILHHGETFTGVLGYPLLALIRKDTQDGFNAMNKALKNRVEVSSKANTQS